MKRLKRIWLVPGLLLIAFVALAAWDVPGPVSAFSLMQAGGSGGGVTAASGIYRPNGDISDGGWLDSAETGNLYAVIDDTVTTPTAGSGDNCGDAETGTTAEISLADVTGQISTVRVHAYCKVTGPADGRLGFTVSGDGTNWSTQSNIDLTLNDTYEWLYTDITSLSLASTSDFRIRLIPVTADRLYICDVIYVEVNP